MPFSFFKGRFFKPRTVAIFALLSGRSNDSARSHPLLMEKTEDADHEKFFVRLCANKSVL